MITATASTVLYAHSHIVGVSEGLTGSTAFCLCADVLPITMCVDLDSLALTVTAASLSLKVQNTFLVTNYLKFLFELAESVENVDELDLVLSALE